MLVEVHGSRWARLTRARLPASQRLYDLRHTHGTHAYVASQGNARAVADRLGHASVSVTLNTYTHTLKPQADGLTEAVEAALFGDAKR